MKVGIVGGGIAGLTAALACKKANIDFHLFEQSDAFKEVGAGIMLSSSTKFLLHQLGVGQHFDECSTPIKNFTITNHQLKNVRTIPTNNIGFSIHRATLIDVLSKPLQPHQYTFNARIEQLIQHADNIEICQNNESHFFDIVIAADGINSAIRKQFLPLVTPRYTNQTIWRGISSMQLPPNFKHAMHEMWGKNLRFGMLHKNDDEFFWYAIKWAQEGEKDNTTTVKEDLKKLFNQYHTIVHEIIDCGENVIRTDLKDIEPNNYTWYNGRIVFIGDAIHACTPHISQGACQAIESAYTLLACLKHCNNNISSAMQLYQTKRKSKTKFITDASYHFGRFNHQRKDWQDVALHKVMKAVPNVFLKYKFNQTINLSYLKKLHL